MNPKRVVVAMSGGVDSSVAAALMLEQGYDVTGIMLKLWTSDCGDQDNACCTPEAIYQAGEVATILGIPFYVVDVQQEFKSIVVDKFIELNDMGFTPNPCYYCNQNIRWGTLLQKTQQLGGEYLVTGHYANVHEDELHVFHLRQGIDSGKDQTYILSGLNQEKLARTIFPLGKYTKSEVREIARNYKFPVAQKPDSQDLCFVGVGGYRNFLKQYGGSQTNGGNIRTITGEVVGHHSGLANYTIGQRKGLGSGFSEPVYVIEKDYKNSEIIIGPRHELKFSEIIAGSFNWILGTQPELNHEYDVKIRYKATPKKARLVEGQNENITISFNEPVRDSSPGQIAVIYNGDEVLGSGFIQKVYRERS